MLNPIPYSWRVALTGLLALIITAPDAVGQRATEIEKRLSFGRVMPDEPVEQIFGFENPTGNILEIENIRLTAPLKAQDVTPVILPGMEGSFRLVLGEDRKPGEFEGIVQINFKDTLHPPINFVIEGFVIPPIEFQPYAAFFVTTQSGQEKSASIEIINHREQPLVLTTAESDSDRFSTRLEIIEKGRRYRLVLQLDGTALPGRKQEEIILRVDPPLDEPLKVRANTFIREPVYTFPETVDLGNLPFKVASDRDSVQRLSQTLMVYRPGTSDFEVHASIDLDIIKLDNERGPDGDRYQLTLTLIPDKVELGSIEGFVRITTNDQNYPILKIPVTGYIIE